MPVYKALEETLKKFVVSSIDTGIADETSTTDYLEDSSKSWDTDVFANQLVAITEGTGVGQIRKIASNTSTRIVPSTAFSVAPDGTSRYHIVAISSGATGGTSNITEWGGTTLTGRDISLDLAKIPNPTPSGNTPVSIEEAGIQIPADIQSQYKNLLDSTTTALGASATYTGDSVDTSRYSRLTGIIYADQGCTLYIDQSGDGTNWDYNSSFSVSAGTGLAFSVESVAAYARMRIVNGATAQSVLRAYLYGRVI